MIDDRFPQLEMDAFEAAVGEIEGDELFVSLAIEEIAAKTAGRMRLGGFRPAGARLGRTAADQ